MNPELLTSLDVCLRDFDFRLEQMLTSESGVVNCVAQPPALAEEANRKLLVITGPSGAGKDTLKNSILSSGSRFQAVKTATTRAHDPHRPEPEDAYVWMRGWDVNMSEYAGAIRAFVEEYDLLEHDVHHGNLYGIPARSIESLDLCSVPVVDVNIEGLVAIRNHFRGMFNTFGVAVLPDSAASLYSRIAASRDNLDAWLQEAISAIGRLFGVIDMAFINQQEEDPSDRIAQASEDIAYLLTFADAAIGVDA